MALLARLLIDQSGASAAEYALLLAIVGTAVALAAIVLGGAISSALSEASVCVETAGGTCPLR